MSRTGRAALLVALTGSAALAATAVVGPVSAEEDDRGLRAAKAIASKYESLERAEAHGYNAPHVCVQSPAGFMGYHYVIDMERIDDRLDPGRPEGLLYADVDGERVLTGIEYIVAADMSDPDQVPPSLWGHEFQGPMEGHEPGMPWHYDLHVWTHLENPAGAWSPWNTSGLRCP